MRRMQKVQHSMYSNPRSSLKLRTMSFAGDVMDYTTSLAHNTRGWTVEKQLVRSATSVGANYIEACNARSPAEFISKASIALQEAEESRYWLQLSIRNGLGPIEEGRRLENEGHEIVKMLMASIRTAKNNQPRRRA